MDELSPSSSFKVKESRVIDLLAATFFYFIVFATLSNNQGNSRFTEIFLFGLVPAIIFTIRAFINATAITINRKGIWFARQVVCTWKDFISAKVDELGVATGDWKDRNVLAIEYFKGTEGDVYKKSMMLVSTQDKSEEEIIKAIEYFYELYKKKAGI